MSPQGIGGDDRCGVFMVLQIIRSVNCHVLFCEDEETGGNGARAFERSRIKVKVNYIVEITTLYSTGAITRISQILSSALGLRKNTAHSAIFRWLPRI